jgi:hypothetical protein
MCECASHLIRCIDIGTRRNEKLGKLGVLYANSHVEWGLLILQPELIIYRLSAHRTHPHL